MVLGHSLGYFGKFNIGNFWFFSWRKKEPSASETFICSHCFQCALEKVCSAYSCGNGERNESRLLFIFSYTFRIGMVLFKASKG